MNRESLKQKIDNYFLSISFTNRVDRTVQAEVNGQSTISFTLGGTQLEQVYDAFFGAVAGWINENREKNVLHWRRTPEFDRPNPGFTIITARLALSGPKEKE